MTNSFRIFYFLFLFCIGLFAQSGKIGDMEINFTSKKPLSYGNNEIVITLKKDHQLINDAKISIRAIMPPMPGMPKMDFKAVAKVKDHQYIALLNFPHGGTWQLRFDIELEGQKYSYKSSVNF